MGASEAKSFRGVCLVEGFSLKELEAGISLAPAFKAVKPKVCIVEHTS